MTEGDRRLAAIMFTDMVGYTARRQRNESLTLALVEEQRKLIRERNHTMGKNSKKIKLMRRTLVLAFAGFVICAGLFAALSVPVASAQGAVQITINNYAFTPKSVTVVIGVNNTVTWTMEQSGVPYHTVTPNPGDPVESWGSGELTMGHSYTFTFTVAGTYGYHCSLHTYMMGTIIVLAASGASSTTSTTTSTTNTSSTTSLASTTSTGSSGSVPEFPFATVGVATFVVLLLAAYILVRRRQIPLTQPGNRPA